MLKITRVNTPGTPTLILSGRIGAEQLPDVRRSVEAEQAQDLVLDPTEVTLVDLEVMDGPRETADVIGTRYGEVFMSDARAVEGVKNVVLVHGGFVDGSGWQGVYDQLKKDGYNVTVVQNPTMSLADDVAVTKRALATQTGPAILVGHSYGGVVVTEAGNDPKVAGLVYIAAFAPDQGESVSSLIQNPPPGAPVPPILPPQDGYLFLDRAKFRASFAADVSADAAAFMADSQVPWGLEALNGAVTEPAWKSKLRALRSTEDKMIPPDAQRAMSKRAGSTVVEVKGSHAVYVSQPQAVAEPSSQSGERCRSGSSIATGYASDCGGSRPAAAAVGCDFVASREHPADRWLPGC
jgi:pimeloyl-ACP methyl ester carboxylesterase